MRAYKRNVIETIPFMNNSDDFIFDSQFLMQTIYCGFKIGDIPVPVRYHKEASSINFLRSLKYGILTLFTLIQYLCSKIGIKKCKLFKKD